MQISEIILDFKARLWRSPAGKPVIPRCSFGSRDFVQVPALTVGVTVGGASPFRLRGTAQDDGDGGAK